MPVGIGLIGFDHTSRNDVIALLAWAAIGVYWSIRTWALTRTLGRGLIDDSGPWQARAERDKREDRPRP